MSLPPLVSPPPDDGVPFVLPPSPPPSVVGGTSPPPLVQIAPVASPPPLPQEAPIISPIPSVGEGLPPANSVPPPNATPPIISPAPASAPIISPPPPLGAAQPPTVSSTPINPVSSPFLPEPPAPSVAPPPLSPPSPPSSSPPPPLLSQPTLPSPPPLAQPPLPSPSQPGTPLPYPPPLSTPKVSPPLPPPLRTPYTPSPTSPDYPPPATFPRQPPPPSAPTSAVKPPPHPLPWAKGSPPVSSKQSHFSSGLVLGCIIGGVLLLLVLVLGFVCFCCKKRRRNIDMIQDQFKELPSPGSKPKVLVFSEDGLPQREHVIRLQITGCGDSHSSNLGDSGHENPLPIQAPYVPHTSTAFSTGTFTYNELFKATNGFSEANLIGEGGFGYVHKGFLRNGQAVAVKQLKKGSLQGEREFQAEVEIITRVHHKHLVVLMGYCIAGKKRLLVYEFVPNKTLKFHLHTKGQNVMDWETRLKIAIGSAKGLAYIHEDCNPTIVHRDIKAANILLDHNFEAKVSDFGLAKIFPVAKTDITHISTRVVGTFGYLAPEYASSGKLTQKSDIYSYGVMLLELITGRPPISDEDSLVEEGLVIWARPLLAQALEHGNFEALVDPRLEKNYDTDEMARLFACAAACVRRSAWLRPRMSQIVHVLEGDISIMDLNGGTKPGDSAMYCVNSSANNNPFQQIKLLADWLANWQNSSGITSEYGINQSSSSSDSTSSR